MDEKWYKLYVLISLLTAFAVLIISLYVESNKNQQGYNQNDKSSTQTEVAPEFTGQCKEKEGIALTPSPVQKVSTERYIFATGSKRTEEIKQYIREIFKDHASITWATVVANCESRFDPMAVSKSGVYKGLFQYHPSTYKSCGGTDIFDWREQVRITKECMYDHGRQGEWPVCNQKANKYL